MPSYALILFLDDINEKLIDIVPTQWIFRNDQNQWCCPFPENSAKYSTDILHKRIKNLKNPLKSWKTYPVDVRGYADSYKAGLKKLEKLKCESFAFTTDTDEGNRGEKEKDFEGKTVTKMTVNKQLSKCSANLNKPLNRYKTDINDDETDVSTSSSSSATIDKTDMYTGSNRHSSPDVSSSTECIQPKVDKTNDMESLFAYMKKSFDKLSQQIGMIQGDVISIKQELHRWKECNKFPNLQQKLKKYDLELPFTTLADFKQFDETLKEKKDLRNEVADIIWPLIVPTEKLSKSVGNIISKFLTRNVVMNYTVVKKIKDKLVFKDTCFCSCIYDILLAEIKEKSVIPIQEKYFYDALGRVFNYAKDWEGYRQRGRSEATSN
ncbi:uncharacterized protein [Prorops nasuta]|uniref:uncharacterized protein n=1 Tax=Prorops nasuta TaxID=863751 RepID=UPI0034CD1033